MDFQLELIALSAAAYFIFRRFHRRNDVSEAFTFSGADDTDEKPFCAVCLNNIAGGESCRKLTECRHCFHVDCVDAWLQNHPTCPLCRRECGRRECGRGILDFFVSWSEIILDKICSPLNQELNSILCENMMYASQF